MVKLAFCRLWKRKGVKFLFIWSLIALLAPIIANEKPILAKQEGKIIFPVFQSANLAAELESIVKPPISYSPNTIDYEHSNFIGPFDSQNLAFRKRHWLGTDRLGRDVLANIIHGAKTAFLVGLGSMLIAGLIGILLGTIAAYLGDEKLKISKSNFLTTLFLISSLLIFQLYLIPWEVNTVSLSFKLILSLSGIILTFLAGFLIKRISSKNEEGKKVTIPIDLIISRCIDIMESIPLLFLIIALSAIIQPSIKSTIIIIGVSSWATIARYCRAEVLKVKNLAYVSSANALGLSTLETTRKHLLPNALHAVYITLAFGVSAAILIESTLSFLGVGLDTSTASWGKLIAASRENFKAWWLMVFPGLAIFLTVWNCNRFAEQFKEKTR